MKKPKYLSIAGGRKRIEIVGNRITDVQNKLTDTKRRVGEGRVNWGLGVTCIHQYAENRKPMRTSCLEPRELCSQLCGDINGKETKRKEVCVHT